MIVNEKGPMIPLTGEVRPTGRNSVNHRRPWGWTGFATLLPIFTFSYGKVEEATAEWETIASASREAQAAFIALLLAEEYVTWTAGAREDEQAFRIAKLNWMRAGI